MVSVHRTPTPSTFTPIPATQHAAFESLISSFTYLSAISVWRTIRTVINNAYIMNRSLRQKFSTCKSARHLPLAPDRCHYRCSKCIPRHPRCAASEVHWVVCTMRTANVLAVCRTVRCAQNYPASQAQMREITKVKYAQNR